MEKILKSYLRRLTNLTASNRSLMLLRLISDQYLDLHDLDFAQDSPSFDIIKKLMGRKQTIQICPLQDPRDEKANKLSFKLKRLHRIEKFIHEERGSKDLFVGWPFLRGKFSDGTAVRCPLMFFPVELDVKNQNWVLKQREEVNTTLNKSFLLAYVYFNQVKISEDLLERVFDDFDTDSTVFRTALYQLFKESPVNINFNPEIFTDKLVTFESFRKDDFENITKSGELKLYPEAVLGIFPQAGSHLVPDYMDLIENNKIPDLESFFASRTRIEDESKDSLYLNFLKRVKEEQIITPFRLDVYQENAIKAVKKGNSVVVQGPPGTGKSQLICNLISDGIAEGKRVLLVSQKRAALDVVYQRLDEKDISRFVALVHDFKNDRKEIYDKIAHQIDQIPEFIQRNNGLDIIQLERQFLQSSRNIDRISEELEEFKHALFDESECGISIKELYLTSDRTGDAINVKQEYRHFRLDQIEDYLRKLEEYFLYASKFTQTSYLLRNRKSFAGFGLQDLRNMQDILEDIPEFQKQLGKKIEPIIGQQLSIEDGQYILERRETIEEFLEILSSDNRVYKYFQNMCKFPEKETDINELSTQERILLDCFSGEGIEQSLATSELGHFQMVLEKAREARKNPVSYIKWRLFSRDVFYLKRVLVANGLKNDRKGLKALVKKIDNRLNLQHNVSNLREREWIIDVPDQYEKLVFQSWFHLQKEALKAKKIFYSLRSFKEYFPITSLKFDDFKARLERLFEILDHIPERQARWIQYFSPTQVSNIIKNPEIGYQLSELLNKDFDALCEFDNLKESLSSIELAVLEKIRDFNDDIRGEEARDIFLNSIKLAWIDHIETKYPVLRSTASMKFHKMVSELQESVESKHRVSTDILLLKARERTYQDVEYNRLNNMVTYRDLYHQVTKKRRIWPLRKLISHFYNEVFDLLPCWMASPEAVSAIFPMDQIFDLVVFDEASQCFTEKGIPAMYRGMQIVIAGDSKQLRPNDLYQIRWEDDPDEVEKDDLDSDLALEVDSLLELSSPYLMNVQLRGHYRSKSLDLIDFSNRLFYENKLSMLPDKKVAELNKPAIHYLQVDGTWENNTNYAEAEKVAELVSEILQNNPGKSIGVVTFNAKQQNLVMDVLEQKFTDSNKILPSEVFVKNIENVQGDERDIIIFSTAYAKDPNGRLIMQFGSLNAEGGENRLNVAVTRAREQVIVVSSISPNQLKVEETKNKGPKILKSYLEYALEVSNGNYKPQQLVDRSHSASWYLKSKLKQSIFNAGNGIVFSSEMPFADISIKQGDKYVGLLMTDDDLYYQSLSVKEAHVYLPHTFTMKNWQYKEVFSREYWIDCSQVKENIMRFINQNTQN